MSDATFTPGPWWVWHGCETIAVKAADRSICNLSKRVRAADMATREWNARLIAAAPELYEALILVTGALIERAPAEQRAIQQAQHAIAKAEGRS